MATATPAGLAPGEETGLSDYHRATLNILEDFAEERERLGDTQSATLNILEDFAEERERLGDTQSATLNIMEDFTQERERLQEMQSATLNMLEDLRESESQIQALNSELEKRLGQVEQANKNLEAFAYSVSHDLRGPLRALSGFSEALVEEYNDTLGETGRDYAERIQRASQRMGTLIDDLLQLSRISRAEMKLEQVDLSAEAQAIAAELRTGEPERQAAFTIQPGVIADADRSLIRAVLQNLLENAWKFTSRRGEASIEFGTEPAEGDATCCYVRDNGAGFNQDYADKLFQPFERLHSAEEFPGSGIGLASVQRIIRRHGGRIWAESAVGEGATFYFTLGGGIRHEPGRNPAGRGQP